MVLLFQNLLRGACGGEEREVRQMRGRPYISAALVIVNIVVFLICTFTGDLLYNIGGLDIGNVLARGQYARILWSLFLHGDVRHLFNNMLILFFLGSMIEEQTGHIQYTILFFLSGIGGNLASLVYKVMNNNFSMSIGASGAIFGLDGALLALVLFAGKRMPTVTPRRVLLMIALSLYSGFTGANVDNAAHVGGLLTGFTAGSVLCIIGRIRKNRNERYEIEY